MRERIRESIGVVSDEYVKGTIKGKIAHDAKITVKATVYRNGASPEEKNFVCLCDARLEDLEQDVEDFICNILVDHPKSRFYVNFDVKFTGNNCCYHTANSSFSYDGMGQDMVNSKNEPVETFAGDAQGKLPGPQLHGR